MSAYGWGRIEKQRDLVHFLLKYKYTDNWEREVRENYIPLSVESFLAHVPKTYRITYMDHAPLPYIVRQIQKDFGFDLTTPTHLKIVLEAQ